MFKQWHFCVFPFLVLYGFNSHALSCPKTSFPVTLSLGHRALMHQTPPGDTDSWVLGRKVTVGPLLSPQDLPASLFLWQLSGEGSASFPYPATASVLETAVALPLELMKSQQSQLILVQFKTLKQDNFSYS